jgi:hypothetical protein
MPCTLAEIYQHFSTKDEGRVQLKCDGTQWRTRGEVKGKLVEWVARPFTLPRNMVYPALLPLMHTPQLPVVIWTDAPSRFKWTRPFRRKTKSGFCTCAITFQMQSTTFFSDVSKFLLKYAVSHPEKKLIFVVTTMTLSYLTMWKQTIPFHTT